MRPSMIMSIPVNRKYHPLIKVAAKATNRNMAAWVRYLIFKELLRLGYVDESFEPTPETTGVSQ